MNPLRASRFYLTALLLALFSSQVQAQAPAPSSKGPDVGTLQQQLESLQTQVTALQDQIKKLATDSATPSGEDAQRADAQQNNSSGATQELTTKQTVSKPTAEYQLNSQDQEAAARYDNAPLDPRYPNYFRLPGTKTFMKIEIGRAHV